MHLEDLPAVNATLNGLATVLLLAALFLIKRGRVTAHRNCMLTAFAVSVLFLISYLTYHIWKYTVLHEAHTPYNGPEPVRTAYHVMLLTHVLLAATVPVLAIVMIRLGLTGRIARHKRLARIAYPVWLYVSVTGVLIYVLLYHFNPGA